MAEISPGTAEQPLTTNQEEAPATSVVVVSFDENGVDVAAPPIGSKEWFLFAKEEMIWLLKLGGPMSGTFIINMISSLVMLFFVGHLGKTELAAAGLGWSVFNFFAYSFGLGLCGALDTFCSQAHGAGTHHRLGVYLQRGILIFTVYIALLLPVMFNVSSILVATGQEPQVAELSGFFVKLMTLSLWPLLLYESLKKFLSAQGISTPMLVSSFVYVSMVTICLYLSIWVFKMGFGGAPLTMAFCNALAPLILLGQAYWLYPTQMNMSWRGWSRDCLRGWGEYLRMGVPAAVLLCTEWWAFEILILLSGVLGVTQLAASQVHLSVLNFVYMLPLGLSIAVNTRVGNLLGAGEPYHAKGVTVVALIFTWVMMLSICCLLLAIRNHWGRLYSTDPSVISLVAAILPIASITVVLDGNQAVCQGILRAAGLQKLGAILNFCCYYIICIPLAVLLAFWVKWDVWGLWISIATAEVFVVVLFLWAIATIDWKEQSMLAKSRTSTDDVAMHPL